MKNLHRFIINYPHNFIEECYGNGWLAEHLQTKFNGLYDKYLSSMNGVTKEESIETVEHYLKNK